MLMWRSSPSNDQDYDIHARISFPNGNSSHLIKADDDIDKNKCWLYMRLTVQEEDGLGLQMFLTPNGDQFLLYFDNTSDVT